ncbi:carbohydrate sulfotransferase 11-like isoform X1 [Mytilus edulis]|uniref:carbohydrate sulfotransferase 11-like isoform X1 n=2 Tax=Mytilus edulis TaxID=6550 RepID=UPI0039EDEE9A
MMWRMMKLRRWYGSLVAILLFPSIVIVLYSVVSVPVSKVKLRLIPNEVQTKSADKIFINQNNQLVNLTEIRQFRYKSLLSSCEQLKSKGLVQNSITKKSLSHIIVDDRYKVLFCYIPKVACTNLKRVFLLLTGKMNATDPMALKAADVHLTYDKYLTYLDSYTEEEVQFKLQNYKKIIMVREPFERLLSAYRNKFTEKSPYFHKRFGRKIIRRYRNNPKQEDIELGKNAKFDEFVRYITDPVTIETEGLNEHWDLYSSLCQPCLINYDFVGKYETLDDDIDYIMHDLGIDTFIQFPKRGAAYKKKRTKDTFEQFYSNISKLDLGKLWKTYRQDYKLFSYAYPDIIKAADDF